MENNWLTVDVIVQYLFITFVSSHVLKYFLINNIFMSIRLTERNQSGTKIKTNVNFFPSYWKINKTCNFSKFYDPQKKPQNIKSIS